MALEAADENGPPLVRQTTPGKLPPFIVSLLPEGWLESVLGDRDERAQLRSGKRYMSNITIAPPASELAALPADVLDTRLAGYVADGVFTGRYEGPGRGDIEQASRAIWPRSSSATTRRASRASRSRRRCSLPATGRSSRAPARPFTHILKPAGTGGFEILPVIEWQALALGAAAGFEAPAMALVAMPDGMPPALIVERFDIRRGGNDTRMLALEDFCSVLALPTEAKYDGTIERVARALRPLSTASGRRSDPFLKRALFAWLIADGDMHLKNLALLKIAEAGSGNFAASAMAPLYDAVTTRVFPRLPRPHGAQAQRQGRPAAPRRFQALAVTAGLRAADADAALDDLTTRLRGCSRSHRASAARCGALSGREGGGADETDRQREDRVVVTRSVGPRSLAARGQLLAPCRHQGGRVSASDRPPVLEYLESHRDEEQRGRLCVPRLGGDYGLSWTFFGVDRKMLFPP